MAIEPNVQMISTATVHERISFHEGTAESTHLSDASIDVVTAFQAFHWFSADAAVREFLRILGPGGRFAAAWNNRDASDPFTALYSEIISESSFMHRNKIAPPHQMLRDFGFTNVLRAEFPYAHRLNREGLLGRARSASYLPLAGPDYERIMQRLEASYLQYADSDGLVSFRYRTVVYRADRP